MNGLPALDSIDESYLRALLDNKVPEGKTVDYKQALPGPALRDRKEFLEDVSSFANAAGGLLVYGMKEKESLPTELCGVGSVNQDEVVNRLEQIATTGLDPRIPGLGTKPVELEGGGYAFVMRIPRSWAGPHMVTLEGSSKFWTRDSKRKHQMDVGEIRAAFLHSETAAKRIRDFRAERLGRIAAGETPALLPANPKVVLHVVPLGAFELGPTLDPQTMSSADRGLLFPMNNAGGNARYNLDGLLLYSDHAYTQLFRNGCIECVEARMIRPRDSGECLPGQTLERQLVSATKRYVSLQQQLGIETPVLVMPSLLGVSGYYFLAWTDFPEREPVDRDDVVIPEVMIEDYDEFLKRPAECLRPALDALSNAGGFSRSPFFDETGRWILILSH